MREAPQKDRRSVFMDVESIFDTVLVDLPARKGSTWDLFMPAGKPPAFTNLSREKALRAGEKLVLYGVQTELTLWGGDYLPPTVLESLSAVVLVNGRRVIAGPVGTTTHLTSAITLSDTDDLDGEIRFDGIPNDWMTPRAVEQIERTQITYTEIDWPTWFRRSAEWLRLPLPRLTNSFPQTVITDREKRGLYTVRVRLYGDIERREQG